MLPDAAVDEKLDTLGDDLAEWRKVKRVEDF